MNETSTRIRLRPVNALLVLLALNQGFLLSAALAASGSGALMLVLGFASVLVPGLVAGYLTARRPLWVGALGAALVYAIGLVWLRVAFGELTAGMLLFDVGSDVAQAAIMVGACVGAHALRRRLG